MQYFVEWDGQFQQEVSQIAEGLSLIAEAEANGEILGCWAGIRADVSRRLAIEVKFHPVQDGDRSLDRQAGESDLDWQSRVREHEAIERLVAAAMRV